jgi:hypothetical protein
MSGTAGNGVRLHPLTTYYPWTEENPRKVMNMAEYNKGYRK